MNSTTEADAAESDECELASVGKKTLLATFAGCFQQEAGAVADRGGVFHGVAGHTILNTAVPTIAAALHVAPLSMKSVLASYTLSLAVFIPISGCASCLGAPALAAPRITPYR
jgi:hypothetical protein